MVQIKIPLVLVYFSHCLLCVLFGLLSVSIRPCFIYYTFYILSLFYMRGSFCCLFKLKQPRASCLFSDVFFFFVFCYLVGPAIKLDTLLFFLNLFICLLFCESHFVVF